MSKWTMTKLKTLLLTLAFTFLITLNFTSGRFTTDIFSSQSGLLTSCMAVESNLPTSHSNHPCHATYMSNKSWLSWLANDNKSAHLHFLDLVELLHYTFH